MLGTCSEYAYHLMPQRWGEGLMSEATSPLLGWAASEHSCGEIELFIEPGNVRSCAFARRHDFTPTGSDSDHPRRWTLALILTHDGVAVN
jgi:RimJ/RimL family protein N-acetyltransferase